VLEVAEERGLLGEATIVRMGVPDRIVTHGDAKLLLAKYGLDADGIYLKVKENIDHISAKQDPAKGLKIVK
jgi:1-deoxy-D-xylulose-5-phosphate synthase